MPIPQQFTVPMIEVRAGDAVAGRIVESKKVGTKWTVLEMASGNNIRRENDELCTVTRQVPTDEELAEKEQQRKAEADEFKTRSILKGIIQTHAAVDKALAKLVTGAQSRHDSQHWEVSRYLKATAERDIWVSVARRMGKQVVNGELVDVEHNNPDWVPMSAIEAFDAEVEAQKQALIEDRYRGGSTDHISNACDVVMRETASSFARHGRWYA